MLIMNKVQNNILGGKLNFFAGKNGQVPSKVNVGPCAYDGLSLSYASLYVIE